MQQHNLLQSVFDYNENFVEEEKYVALRAEKFPAKKLAIVTCMDTRLVELLPQALNLHNGDINLIKTVGGVITGPWDANVRSLLVAIHQLGVSEVWVIGHDRCGMQGLEADGFVSAMLRNGVTQDDLQRAEGSHVQLSDWMKGFEHVEDSVKDSVGILRNHPFIPKTVPVYGLVIDPDTGKLRMVVDATPEERDI